GGPRRARLRALRGEQLCQARPREPAQRALLARPRLPRPRRRGGGLPRRGRGARAEAEERDRARRLPPRSARAAGRERAPRRRGPPPRGPHARAPHEPRRGPGRRARTYRPRSPRGAAGAHRAPDGAWRSRRRGRPPPRPALALALARRDRRRPLLSYEARASRSRARSASSHRSKFSTPSRTKGLIATSRVKPRLRLRATPWSGRSKSTKSTTRGWSVSFHASCS